MPHHGFSEGSLPLLSVRPGEQGSSAEGPPRRLDDTLAPKPGTIRPLRLSGDSARAASSEGQEHEANGHVVPVGRNRVATVRVNQAGRGEAAVGPASAGG